MTKPGRGSAKTTTAAADRVNAGQHYMLGLATKKADGFIHYRDAMYVAYGRGNASIMKGLVRRKWMAPSVYGWAITPDGRNVLAAITPATPTVTNDRDTSGSLFAPATPEAPTAAPVAEDDYSAVWRPDGTGKTYQSAKRIATYQWIRAGRTEIRLRENDMAYDGWIEQGEKADGVCLAWILRGEQSKSLRQDAPPPSDADAAPIAVTPATIAPTPGSGVDADPAWLTVEPRPDGGYYVWVKRVAEGIEGAVIMVNERGISWADRLNMTPEFTERFAFGLQHAARMVATMNSGNATS